MDIRLATDASAWDGFLLRQRFRPFLQSWTMGEVYGDIGQEPVRLEVRDGMDIKGICFAHVVPAKRGRHLSVPYGPVIEDEAALPLIIETLKEEAKKRDCAFIRLSPFWLATTNNQQQTPPYSRIPVLSYSRTPVLPYSRPSPLHLLAEHIWYLPLTDPDRWAACAPLPPGEGLGVGAPAPEEKQLPRTENDILKAMRPTARNLIRRAEKEGVTVERSADPMSDLEHFLALHEETRKRHCFTPYSTAFFRAQVSRFAPRNECSLYMARYQGEVIASSIHMHCGGETSYHHGASAQKYRNIPASYLLQWTAISDALKRGDRIYNFWGISPEGMTKHPFAGVRTFKTAFGGRQLDLVHCTDIPLSKKYLITFGIETIRKWRRGF